jgi:putative tricarboxylic transport membrane protein
LKKYDLSSSVVWMVTSAFFLRGAIGLGLGGLTDPGPGFFPFVVSLSLLSLSAVLFVVTATGKNLNNIPAALRWPEADGTKRILLTVSFLTLYVLTLDYLGFALTTFLFIFFLLRFVEPQTWLTVFLGACLTTGFSYMIFEVWLKGSLPTGFLGF